MAGATKSITINAPIEKVFAVIADYEKYPQFLPEVKELRVSDRKGNEVTVHYKVDVMKTVNYSVRMKEEGPAKVSWSFIKGEVMKDNKGSWSLKANGDKTEATYNVEMDLGLFVPKAIINALTETNLPKMLEAFKKRVESQK